MKPTDLPREVKCALALHEMLRRMGFAPDEIFVAPYPPPHELQVVIQAQGKEFRIDVGMMTLSVEKFIDLWPRAAQAQNEIFDNGDMRKLLDGLRGLDLVALGVLLRERGFIMPGLDAAAEAVQAEQAAGLTSFAGGRAQA